MVDPASACTPSRIPLATYRLQFNREFTFAEATAIADYLRDLGISDCYASPLFQAGPQSTHGYDVCGFQELSSTLGGRGQFERFTDRLRELGLGLLLDMVPNHMGANLSNLWWRDVLTHGPSSRFAAWFDIDWRPRTAEQRGQVLLPSLGDHYGKVLQDGELKLLCDEGTLALAYHEKRFPLSPESVRGLLEEDRRGASGNMLPGTAEHLQDLLQHVNGSRGSPSSFDRLHSLLRQQHYRLAFWRVGPEEINYRRFFDVTELVSLRMEVPEVFEAVHELVFDLLREGRISGLRIDHPDGLWDPKAYFERLQKRAAANRTIAGSTPAPERTGGARGGWPLYIVAEKILSGEEALPADWPVCGTTGYDFLNRVNGLFVDTRRRAEFDSLYADFVKAELTYSALVPVSKKQILRTLFASEWQSLSRRLKQLAAGTREAQDLTLSRLSAALLEIVGAFPVYRTYITENTTRVSEQDRNFIQTAVREAGRNNPGLDQIALGFIEGLLLSREWRDLEESGRKAAREFVMRFQQLTGPVMAKGVEDTAFYVYNRLVSLNEVGGNPESFGAGPEHVHEWNIARAKQWPYSLLATATHDTKRGEDLRARLNVLSEIPEEWHTAIRRWRGLNEGSKSIINGVPAPHPNDEYFFYQALTGAWETGANSPAGLIALRQRLVDYMLKAIREAKTDTSWVEPNAGYEQATRHFVESVLDPLANGAFLDDFKSFQQKVAFFGRFNSLSQLLLKLTCPGVPDLYQGTELWDHSLVDPDNRRPVNFDLRRRLLFDVRAGCGNEPCATFVRDLCDRAETGLIKLYLTWRTLQFRQNHRTLFQQGDYVPLRAHGAKREHVCAFARVLGDELLVVVVPRLVVGLAGENMLPPMGTEIWEDTCLRLADAEAGASCKFRNVLTGDRLYFEGSEQELELGRVLAHFPVALLQRV